MKTSGYFIVANDKNSALKQFFFATFNTFRLLTIRCKSLRSAHREHRCLYTATIFMQMHHSITFCVQ